MDRRMIFSADLNTLYVSIPKTGSTTIKTIVAAALGIADPEILLRRSDGGIHNVLLGQSGKWSDLTDADRKQMLFSGTVFRFTSVRNPYERLVSCYLDKIADGRPGYYLRNKLLEKGDVTLLSFLKFIADQPPLERDVHCRSMIDLCYSGEVDYSDIVRYETFDEDLRRIMEKLNMAKWPIPKPFPLARTFAASHIHDLLGVEECALIQNIYQHDFDAFGYSRDLSAVNRRR